MKEKLKFSPASIISVIKSSLVGVVASILLVLLFAFVLKFVDLNSSVITIVDQIIKIISVFISVVALSRSDGDKLLAKGLIVGAIYSILTFIVFSILNGGINFSVAIFSDVAFSALVGGVSGIIINMFKRK